MLLVLLTVELAAKSRPALEKGLLVLYILRISVTHLETRFAHCIGHLSQPDGS